MKRNNPKPNDLVFPQNYKKQFNRAMTDCGYKLDREGNRRLVYNLRRTYLCLRLLEGANIYQIAESCQTRAEIIENHHTVKHMSILD
ncbi:MULTISPECIES: hypothetical protein [Agrobacterium]|uniref:hypothetical protein n=1 Tax=Agrobacterium TaxID=357 RepID=UPI0004A1152B|nr:MULTISPECIES: hypothetical protein [Agrobacterium]KDR87948.1 hypothetical protein K538_12905 [Agrobacterium tumefaciens GW4]